jgi:hypothetical protein
MQLTGELARVMGMTRTQQPLMPQVSLILSRDRVRCASPGLGASGRLRVSVRLPLRIPSP